MADEIVDAEVVDTGAPDQAVIDAGVDEISEGLGFGKAEPPKNDAVADAALDADATDPPADAAIEDPPITVRAVPKSWAKEQHERWGKIDPETQAYIELREKQMLDGIEQYKGDSGYGKQMRETMTPYKALLDSQGVDEAKAIKYLMNGHYRLSTGTPAERGAYLAQIAKQYGADISALTPSPDAPKVDPAVQALNDKVANLEGKLTAKEQGELATIRAKVANDVNAFAADSKNIYFDECADDIAALVAAGHTLETAYEKAVYANPVTRAKELARIHTETDKSLRAKAAAEAEAARKAKAGNVRSRDTRRAPTEPLGTMEDTMKATLKEIRERPH